MAAPGSPSGVGILLARWARLVHRHRLLVLLGSLVLLLASVAVMSIGSDFGNGSTLNTESDRADQLLGAELHYAQPAFTVVASSSELRAGDAAFRSALTQAFAPLHGDPNVTAIILPYRADGSLDGGRVSADQHHVLVTVNPVDWSRLTYEEIRPRLDSDTLQLLAAGAQPVESEYNRGINADASRGEQLSIPVSVALLLLVFGGVVAALLPLGVAVLATVGGLAVVAVLSQVANVDGSAQNVVIFLGLGLGIDYSLFVVSRFREELRHGREREDALAVTMSTAGRAITVSGMTVAIGLLGMLAFTGTWLASFALAVTGVVVLAIVYALTFLPAVLSLLGPRVDRLRIRRVRVAEPGRSRWHTLAMTVMQHPLRVLLPCLLLFAVAFIPFTQIRFGTDHLTTLPASYESRQSVELIRQQFPEAALTDLTVVVHWNDGRPLLSSEHLAALQDLRDRLAALPGVLRVPQPGPQDAGRTIVALSVLSAAPERSDTARAVVAAVRATPAPAGAELLVTGQTAGDIDFVNFIDSRIPWALGFVVVATYLVLLLLFRSVVLPLKALLMNLLSISASFGALVFVFQQGHLSGPLDFTPAPIDPALPVILFCILFGLSMDYEVFLLTRIQEEWRTHGDTRRAVAAGLERSAPLVTGAAAIMIAVVACFGLGSLMIMKIIGLGMALAVLVDATIVRALVVPAVMRLMGDANWWSPRWLDRLLGRLPQLHVEQLTPPQMTTPAAEQEPAGAGR